MKQFEEFLLDSKPELEKFSDFVLKWQRIINLIAPSTIKNIWERHILDSAQLYPYIPAEAQVLADMGSGGGFPALVLAIINKVNNGPVKHFYLIESDNKKSIFLKEAARVFFLPVTVLNQRIETVFLDRVDIVTARALKPVDDLLRLGQGIITPQTMCLFLKGERADDELRQNSHTCSVEIFPSRTHENGCILQITNVQK